ncbi:MAG TPA: cation:proton antiporter [Spirochaetota bacterium]|nr:cation:proton antiporter [Spirochaetota bacterium]HRR60102.1 cation:proton antiporter [Spirochaetota bacterium]
MPGIIGQIIAGVVIGPTFIGNIMPDFFSWLFPSSGYLKGVVFLGLIFIMLKIGIEVELSSIFKQGKSIVVISFFSIIIPFLVGFFASWYCPVVTGGSTRALSVSLFFSIAIAITALPVIAKILLDVKIFHSDLGMVILISAMINDIIGWILFSSLIKSIESEVIAFSTIVYSLLVTITFAIFIVTIFRYVLNEILPFIQAKMEWPGSVITITLVLSMFIASFTESIGMHAFFGAFLAGIAIGDSSHIKSHTKDILNQFIDNFFSPLFFVSIGLQINLLTHFSLLQSLSLIIMIFISNIIGSFIAGTIVKNTFRDSLAIGIGMSTSGTMGIIVGLFALQYGIINQTTYTSIVIMAVVTSLAAGPLLKLILKPPKAITLIDLIDNNFIPDCKSNNRYELIHELANEVQKRWNIDAEVVAQKIIEREMTMSTGIGNAIAVPHARLTYCKKPLILCTTSKQGIDFDAPDGKPAHIIFLIITPHEDHDSQIYILAEISRIFSNASVRDKVMNATNNNEFIAILKNTYHMLSLRE